MACAGKSPSMAGRFGNEERLVVVLKVDYAKGMQAGQVTRPTRADEQINHRLFARAAAHRPSRTSSAPAVVSRFICRQVGNGSGLPIGLLLFGGMSPRVFGRGVIKS